MKLVEIDQLIAEVKILRLNDPNSLNAMSDQMAAEFKSCIATIAQDSSVRGLVIIGCGRAFSAGGDLEMLKSKTSISVEENKEKMLDFYRCFLSIRDLQIPTLALINGIAVGAGLCLACACDIRFCSEQAKLGFNFGRLGLHPGMGATYFVPRLVGPAIASELFLAGETITAKQAAKIGLVNKTCAELELFKTAEKFFTNVVSTGKLSNIQLITTLRAAGNELDLALQREAQCQAENFVSQEFASRIQAAIDRRK